MYPTLSSGPTLRGQGVITLVLEKGNGPQMSEPVMREHMPSYINKNKGSIGPLLFVLPWIP
jgi:hypothetical protein